MNIKLDPTGERYIPALMGGQIEAEHMQRYRSVLRLIEGKKVLDAACGAVHSLLPPFFHAGLLLCT